jgi:hypothetical protein
MAIRVSSPLRLLALSSVALSLAAQSTGVTTSDLKGVVKTTGGSTLAGALVSLTQDSTNLTFSIVADEKGAFAFRLLPPGSYTLVVEGKGMSTKKVSGIILRLGQTTNLPVEMTPVEAQAVVEITGESTLVDPSRTTVSSTIDNNFITNLPINRRDFTNFSLTTPQVAVDNSPARNLGAASSSGLTFSGQSARQNNIMVDGLDNNDVSVGSTRATFSQDAIQEFVVVANGFSAEYGRAAGGTLNIVTKSGGNDHAGSLFYFFRNDSLEAKRPLSSQSTSFAQQQFGATFSGPLMKDKLFYFVSVERFNKDDTNNININPAVAAKLNTYLTASSGKTFTVANGINDYNENYTTAIVKLDWNQSPSSRWSLRLSQAKENNENQLPWSGQNDRSAGGSREIKDSSVSISNLWTISSSFVNDFRVLSSKRDHTLISLDDTQSPSIVVVGYANVGTQRFLPQLRTETTKEFVDTLSWFSGNHTVKFGVDLMDTGLEGSLPLQFGGVYRFQGLSAAVPDGAAALNAPNPFGGTGLPAAFIQGFGQYYLNYTAKYYSAFLQDDWQIGSSFTLKMGLRFDKETLPPFHDSPDYAALAAGGPQQLTTINTYALPGSTGATVVPNSYQASPLFQTVKDWSSSRVSPRLAFNWQVGATNRIYGGYGHFSGRTQLGPYSAVLLNNGMDMVTMVQIVNADPSNPTAPWQTWATRPTRRYSSFPGGIKTLLLPGAYEMPLTKQANLGWEFTPRPSLKFTVDAVHVKGEHYMNVRDVNALVPNAAANFSNPDSPANPYLRRVDTRYSSVIRYDGSGESKHTAVALGTAWQMQDRISLSLSYTWSKTEDNIIDWVTDFSPVNTFDPKAEMATSNQDQRHRILASAVFNTKGFNSAWTKDWIISLLGRFASGRPYSVLTGRDRDYGVLASTPGNPATARDYGNGDGGATPAERPNGLARNSENLPFTQNVDLRFSRTFRFQKKLGLEVIMDVFNVFNHYNISQVQNVQGVAGSYKADYGQPIVQSNVDFNRQIQLGARFTW